MSALPLPPKETTNRELLSLARRIERYSVQRRKLLERVEQLEGQIREAKRMFRALTDLIAAPLADARGLVDAPMPDVEP